MKLSNLYGEGREHHQCLPTNIDELLRLAKDANVNTLELTEKEGEVLYIFAAASYGQSMRWDIHESGWVPKMWDIKFTLIND